jgi:transposase
MIWFSLRGLTVAEIAALFEYDPRTVRRSINRNDQEGVVGLEDRTRSGPPRLGSAGLGSAGRESCSTESHAVWAKTTLISGGTEVVC